MANSWPILMKFGIRVAFDEKTTRKIFQPDRSTPSVFFGYLRACMAFMPNFWPISIKFGMSIVLDKKGTRKNFNLIGSLLRLSSGIIVYLRVCMASLPNSWQISMKFGLSVFFDKKQLSNNFKPIGSLLAISVLNSLQVISRPSFFLSPKWSWLKS